LDASSFSDYFCNTVCVPTSPAALFRTDVYNPATFTLQGWTGSVGGSVNRFASPFVSRNSVIDASYFLGLFYDFTDRWTASFEGRSQKETIYNYNISSRYRTDVTLGASALPLLDPTKANNAVIGGKIAFTSFLPRVNVQFKITPDAQVYATYSKGNNPGGINTATQLGLPGSGTTEDQRAIREEVLKNYEVGFKTLWLENRLKINGAIYQMKWDNLQNSGTYFYVPPGSPQSAGVFFGITENRGAAKIDGFGIDAEFAPTRDWTFRGQVSYNHGTYEKFCSIQLANLLYGPASGLPGASLLGADPRCLAAGSGGQFNTRAQLVSGNELETAPKKTASLGFEYHMTVMGDWTLTPRGNVQYSDGQWTDEMNLVKSPSWYMLELGVGLDKGNTSFEIFCRNCNDEDAPLRSTRLTDPYGSNAPVASGGLGYNQTIGNNPRRPRQFGARVSWKF
jgi:iron complex outermembrane receptor protein